MDDVEIKIKINVLYEEERHDPGYWCNLPGYHYLII